MNEPHQTFGVHPVYDMKRRTYDRAWYAKPEATGQNPEQHVLNNPVPTGQPLVPTWSSEQIMRMIQANTRINPDGVKAVHVDPQPTHSSGLQPTNPEIIERLEAYGELGNRKWYATPWIPYVGYPRRELQSGIQV